MKKALVAMSGGVDSSVAAKLTQKAGFDCVGIHMKLHPCGTETYGDKCGSPRDEADAKSVAKRLEMPFVALDCSKQFEKKVVENFVTSYEQGETPNPCIECNRHLKFGHLYEKAAELGCEKVVTGHYARVKKMGDRWQLLRALDPKKDQSYVLYFLTQEQLAHTYFPLGELEGKEQVRSLAEQFGFENANRPDSQDICFVPDGDYAAFLSRYTGKTYPEGNFVDLDGKVLGRHKGLVAYTVGQRRGLGLALAAPGYVIEKRIAQNEIVVAPHEYLLSTTLRVGNLNWIAFDRPPQTIRAQVCTRYQAPPVSANIEVLENGEALITFDTPQRRSAAGQSAVFYEGDVVLGGGIIKNYQYL